MAIELTRVERDAVRSEILTVLTEVGDFTGYVDGRNVAKARELGERFNDCLALLDDLGWEAEDKRESFELSGQARQLARVLPQLQHHSAGLLTTDILEAQFNQRGMERTALANAVLSRAIREIEHAPEPESQDQPPPA